MKACIRYLVSGRVQGVFFRASTRERAQSLGLTGWARNLPDGRVEVLACGDQATLGQFRAWLREGPPQAQVEDIEEEERPVAEEPAGFDVR